MAGRSGRDHEFESGFLQRGVYLRTNCNTVERRYLTPIHAAAHQIPKGGNRYLFGLKIRRRTLGKRSQKGAYDQGILQQDETEDRAQHSGIWGMSAKMAPQLVSRVSPGLQA